MATNRSLWQDTTGVPGVIRESPLPCTLEDRKLLLKVHCWAMNPCDAILQDTALPFVKYPVILGQDVAGIVEAVGSTAAAKFQDYVLLDHTLAAKIPDFLSFNDASVFPLCITTSSFALLSKEIFSSAVGSNAIQLAKAAGFEVVTTSSPRNFNYVKRLGADKVFDYSSPSVTDDVAAELDKGTCAGIYLAVGKVADACQVSHKSKHNLFVASSNPIMPTDVPEGVEARMTFSTGGIDDFKEILPIAFDGYLLEALARGMYQVAPPPEVVSTKGREGIQAALDLLKKGVSAKKVVVEAH